MAEGDEVVHVEGDTQILNCGTRVQDRPRRAAAMQARDRSKAVVIYKQDDLD